jgi:hypothetical protein
MSTITVGDGTTIFYKDWGPQNVQPIVFHYPSYDRSLREIGRRLGNGHHVRPTIVRRALA